MKKLIKYKVNVDGHTYKDSCQIHEKDLKPEFIEYAHGLVFKRLYNLIKETLIGG